SPRIRKVGVIGRWRPQASSQTRKGGDAGAAGLDQGLLDPGELIRIEALADRDDAHLTEPGGGHTAATDGDLGITEDAEILAGAATDLEVLPLDLQGRHRAQG